MVAPNSHSANINPVRENLQEQRASNNSASLFMLDFFLSQRHPSTTTTTGTDAIG